MSHNPADLDDEGEFALTDLLPQYFALCRKDLEYVRRLFQDDKLDNIRTVGHNLKGSGGAYGFAELSSIGLAIETAAKAGDRKALERHIEEFADFLRAHP
jgi:HPt (histidine-containing phosphotransfer) domain-containing protein